jgi:hypothetical protein
VRYVTGFAVKHRNAPDQIVTSAEVIIGRRHCVTFISLTVSDTSDVSKRFVLITDQVRPSGSYALAVRVSVPYAGAVPDGLIRLRRSRPSAPPSSSGLGHRPFKAAARVRIPLGARVGYGWRYEVL